MAKIKSKTLFFTTSPRTPNKMIPEIELLGSLFIGKPWNAVTQEAFGNELAKSSFFESQRKPKNPALTARDRITRAPKALGFVDLKPAIALTEAGQRLISGKRTEEVILRQLLKFQLPSPYHTAPNNGVEFRVKPYLEILRLVNTFNKVTFDEIMVFGMQLTDYHKFDEVVSKIEAFRLAKSQYTGKYKKLFWEIIEKEIRTIYAEEIKSKKTKTRESDDFSEANFIRTKKRNLRDYTDACFRYLRSTGLVAISHKGKSLSIMPDKQREVDYILENIGRDPVFTGDEAAYKQYLFQSTTPQLLTDDSEHLCDYIMRTSKHTRAELVGLSLDELKDLREKIIEENRNSIISAQVKQLKAYSLYAEVIDTYNEIITNSLYDVPLMLEWNTWRAMTMLDGGNITGNFKVDDAGWPMSTAPANMPDIVCDYGDFDVTVEVTMMRGQRQYETEQEPIARHLGKHKKDTGKQTFCLFIAPYINPASIAHFFVSYKVNVEYYGGIAQIVPLELDTFMKLIDNSYNAKFVPTPQHIQEIFLFAKQSAETAQDENQWYSAIQKYAQSWVATS
jgi:hypothetical protein